MKHTIEELRHLVSEYTSKISAMPEIPIVPATLIRR